MALTTYKTAATSDRAAVIRYLDGLGELGWIATAYNNGDGWETFESGTSRTAKLEEIMAADECTVRFVNGENRGAIFFVFGNSPWEVAADSTTAEPFATMLADVEAAIN